MAIEIRQIGSDTIKRGPRETPKRIIKPDLPRPRRSTPRTVTFHFTPPSHTDTQMGLWEGVRTAKVAKNSICVREGVNGE